MNLTTKHRNLFDMFILFFILIGTPATNFELRWVLIMRIVILSQYNLNMNLSHSHHYRPQSCNSEDPWNRYFNKNDSSQTDRQKLTNAKCEGWIQLLLSIIYYLFERFFILFCFTSFTRQIGRNLAIDRFIQFN